MAARYLLDTHICIYIAKYTPPAVRERFARHAASEFAMSLVTLGELRFGAEKSQARDHALASIRQLENLIPVSPLSEPAGEHYGQIRAALQKKRSVHRQQRPLAGRPCQSRRVDTGR